MAFQSKEQTLATYTPDMMNPSSRNYNPEKVMEIWNSLLEAKGDYDRHVEVVLKFGSVLGYKAIVYMILSLSRGEVPHYLLDSPQTEPAPVTEPVEEVYPGLNLQFLRDLGLQV